MTEAKAAPDLTPPSKVKNGAGKSDPNKPKKEAAPKAEKPPKEPKVKGKYSRDRNSIIRMVEGKEVKARGQRGDWYKRVQAFAGKTVEEFVKANGGITNGKGNAEPPTGWLRFFVSEGVVTLETPAAPAEGAAPAKPVESAPAAPASA